MNTPVQTTQTTHGRQSRRSIRRLGVLAALVVGLLLPLVGGVHVTHAAGNSDAAHACQQGGYLNLTGIDSTGQPVTFANAGQCVSFAAHGGFIPGLTPCVVTSTTGCLTFNNATLPWFSVTDAHGDFLPGYTITVTGATSFVDACSTPGVDGLCRFTPPNALATGGGTYVERDSTGAVVSQGIYRIADTAGWSEGLATLYYLDSNSNVVSSCAAATGLREVFVDATLIDSSTGATQTAGILGVTGTLPDALYGSPLPLAGVGTTSLTYFGQEVFLGTVSDSAMSLTC